MDSYWEIALKQILYCTVLTALLMGAPSETRSKLRDCKYPVAVILALRDFQNKCFIYSISGILTLDWNVHSLIRRETPSVLYICSFRENKIKNSIIIELQLMQMATIEIFFFKHTIAAYLELHNCISQSSNCQKFLSYSPSHIYCLLLPIHANMFVNIITQNRVGLLCIWWTESR